MGKALSNFCVLDLVGGIRGECSSVARTQLYFDMKAFVTVILSRLGPHKEMECPCFAMAAFTVTAVYQARLSDTQSFLGKWTLLSVDITHPSMCAERGFEHKSLVRGGGGAHQ